MLSKFLCELGIISKNTHSFTGLMKTCIYQFGLSKLAMSYINSEANSCAQILFATLIPLGSRKFAHRALSCRWVGGKAEREAFFFRSEKIHG